MKKYAILAVVLLAATSMFAADLNGKWVAQIVNANNGSVTERIFNLNVAAGKLTGTVVNQAVTEATFEQPGKKPMTGTLKTLQGKPVEIIEGQVTGDSVTFAIMNVTYQGQMKVVYTGTMAGNELKLTAETKIPEGAKTPSGAPMTAPKPQDMVAKRTK